MSESITSASSGKDSGAWYKELSAKGTLKYSACVPSMR